MKYISLTLMILAILTGFTAIGQTTMQPFTTDLSCDFYTTEYVYLDETFTTSASVYPSNSKDKDLTWRVSDESIAKITDIDDKYSYSKVTITPYKAGTVTVTVSANKNISKSFELEVKPRPVSSVTISTTCPYTTILTGSNYSLTSNIAPTTATDKTIVWASSNSSVIEVDQDGNFRAIGEGTATITATAHNGLYDSKTFVVRDNIYIESINITDTSTSLSLYRYNSRTLSYTYLPQNANVLDVTWSSDDTSIVTVDANGKIQSVGPFGNNVKITVKTSNGITDYIYVNVPQVHASSISIVSPGIGNSRLDIGQTLQLSYKINPSSGVTDEVVWSSSHPELMSVSQTGKVTGHAITEYGVVITVTCGSVSDSIILFCYNLP